MEKKSKEMNIPSSDTTSIAVKSSENLSSAIILVVDDNAWNRETLVKSLMEKGIQVVSAENGTKALELIPSNKFNLILLDSKMPKFNGIEVLKKARQDFSPLELPIIMMTARGEAKDIIASLEAGANDYITKPIDFPVAFARIKTHLILNNSYREIEELKQNLGDKNEKLERANNRFNRDLEAAASIQQAQLPEDLPAFPGVNFAWVFEPHEKLAGDMLHVFPIGSKKVGFFVLDVSGHGAPAALLSVTVSRHITGLQGELGNKLLENPQKILQSLNQRFTMDNMGGNFFTIAYCVLHLDTLELCYCLAGHPGMVYLPKNGVPCILDKPAIPIGFFDDSIYLEEKLQLQNGDRMVLYSDGIVEASDCDKVSFGKEKLKETLFKTLSLTLALSFKKVLEDVKTWCKPGRPADDLTILGVEINQDQDKKQG